MAKAKQQIDFRQMLTALKKRRKGKRPAFKFGGAK